MAGVAYGCSRWKEGCGFRLPFDEAGNPLDEETLQKRIQDYNPNTHLNHE
jgi:DNA topoisomerase-3